MNTKNENMWHSYKKSCFAHSWMICLFFILFCKMRATFNHLANEPARLARLLLGPKTYAQASISRWLPSIHCQAKRATRATEDIDLKT